VAVLQAAELAMPLAGQPRTMPAWLLAEQLPAWEPMQPLAVQPVRPAVTRDALATLPLLPSAA